MRTGILIAVMAAVTMLTRFLPFLVMKEKTPAFVTYLGKVLPPAVMGMLVVYCLRDTQIMSAPHGLPEAAAAAVVIGLQVLKRNTLISILAGTAVYMLLTHAVF